MRSTIQVSGFSSSNTQTKSGAGIPDVALAIFKNSQSNDETHNLRPTLAALKSGGFHLCDSPQHDRSIRIALLEGNDHHGAYLNSGAVERRQRPALSPVNANLYSARGPRVSIVHDYSSVNAKPCHWPLP